MLGSVADRFWSNVQRGPPDRCWLWSGPKSHAKAAEYGHLHLNGRNVGAHRLAYELHFGPIPDGMSIDHVRLRGCVSTLCVNPAHLEAVPIRVNILRGSGPTARNADATHCIRGHAFTPLNTEKRSGGRNCRECRRAEWREWYQRRGRLLRQEQRRQRRLAT